MGLGGASGKEGTGRNASAYVTVHLDGGVREQGCGKVHRVAQGAQLLRGRDLAADRRVDLRRVHV